MRMSHMIRINKMLPAGFKLEVQGNKKAPPPTLEQSRRARKRPRTRQKERLRVKGSEWAEKDWGLKMGGEPARKCYEILQNLKKHSLAGPFLQPVDPVALNLPNYLEVIRDPIDLSTVERNLKAGVYSNSQQFAVDVRRIWLNSFTYNAVETDMFYITLELCTYFERQFKEVENMIFSPGPEIKFLQRDKEKLLDYMNSPMSQAEKRLLAANLRRLTFEQMIEVHQIVTNGKGSHPLSFKFNIDHLPARTCRDLEKYVKLTHQASLRGNRQRNLWRMQYVSEGEARKKRLSNYYDEMEYY